jgi:hypothetical protein
MIRDLDGDVMKEQITRRLEELRAEFEVGQTMLAELDARQMNLKNSLLRIGGAIQVLEELVNKREPVADDEQVPVAISSNR